MPILVDIRNQHFISLDIAPTATPKVKHVTIDNLQHLIVREPR